MGRLVSYSETLESKTPKFTLSKNGEAYLVIGLEPIDSVEDREDGINNGQYYEVEVEEENGKKKKVLTAISMTQEYIHNYQAISTDSEGRSTQRANPFKCLSQIPNKQGSCCLKFHGSSDYRKPVRCLVVGQLPVYKKGRTEPYNFDDIKWMYWKLTKNDWDNISMRRENSGLNCILQVSCGSDGNDEKFHKYTLGYIDYTNIFKPSEMTKVFEESTRIREGISIGADLTEEQINALAIVEPTQVNNQSSSLGHKEPAVQQEDLSDMLEDSTEDLPF